MREHTEKVLALWSDNNAKFIEIYYLNHGSMTEAANKIGCSSRNIYNVKFKALDELADIAVIVPYGEPGRQIIADLLALPSAEEMSSLLRKAQMFTVNITEFAEKKLCEAGAICRLEKDDFCIWVAKETNYDCEYLGLKADAGHLETNIL